MGHCLFLRKGEVHTAPVTGVLASSLAVGSTVKLMEGGTAVEYLVVNQGIPQNSSLYDASCDGTWLLRKDIYITSEWNNSLNNLYANSTIYSYLNNGFFALFDTDTKSRIKQAKIPYSDSYFTVASGDNGLSTKIFLLSGYEVGWTTDDNSSFPIDGAKLTYFIAGSNGNSKRPANYNDVITGWYLRSRVSSDTGTVWYVMPNGNHGYTSSTELLGIRPALILPGNALFDKTTMLLKGVK